MYHWSESISFLGPKIWNILPDRLKNANSIEAFKVQIKKWPISALQVLYSKCRFCLGEFLRKEKNERFHVKHEFMIL